MKKNFIKYITFIETLLLFKQLNLQPIIQHLIRYNTCRCRWNSQLLLNIFHFNNKTKNEFLCIWIWIIIKNENLFNVSHQFVTAFEKWFNWQTSIIITTHNNLKKVSPKSKSLISVQKHLKLPQFEALYRHSLSSNFHSSSCSIAWTLRVQSWHLAFSCQRQWNQSKSTN